MKKLFIISILLLIGSYGFGQEIKTLIPELYTLDFSIEKEKLFNLNLKRCNSIWDKLSKVKKIELLSIEDRTYLENCNETVTDYWDIIGGGCSWYCGGGPKEVTASSFLYDEDSTKYQPQNAHDLDYKNAWIEGVKGYGVGEYLLYHFGSQSPRITEIIVVNGYVKNEYAWKNNSRVKTLKVYIDGKPYAVLSLSDERSEQRFKLITPIGTNPVNWVVDGPEWTIKFEIIDVYKGDKYDDTVITEIYFDGIDVH